MQTRGRFEMHTGFVALVTSGFLFAVVEGCVDSSNNSGPPIPEAGTISFDGGGGDDASNSDTGTNDGSPGDASPGDGGADAAINCPAPNGKEITHTTTISADETWAGDGTVHYIANGFSIKNATLTFAPCAVVKVAADAQITIDGQPNQPAKLVSQGTATQPVLVTAYDPAKPWGFFRGLADNATADLAYTTFEKGGSNTFDGASLHLRGSDANKVIPMLRADHFTVKGSAGIGIVMESGAAFTSDSTFVSVTGGGSTQYNSAMLMAPLAAGTLPPVDISGNVNDEIRLAAVLLTIQSDLTLHKRAPYHFFFDRVRVFSPTASPTVTIDPGVEIRSDDYIEIGNGGTTPEQTAKLLALGTAADPIVFTSSKATKAAGDWPGIFLDSAAGSKLQNVRIEFAGGFNGIVSNNCKPAGSDDHAALFIGGQAGTYIPAASDFSNVTVTSSASHGINPMWVNATFGPDLTAGFTFNGIAGCKQTKNNTPNGCQNQPGCLVP